MNERVARKVKPEPEQVYPDAFAMVNDYLARFGQSVGTDLDPLDAEGFTDVRHGALVIGVNVAIQQGTLMFLARMADLPSSPPADLFKKLLELNFVATGDCAFAIDQQRDAIYLRATRGLQALDYDEFSELDFDLFEAGAGLLFIPPTPRQIDPLTRRVSAKAMPLV